MATATVFCDQKASLRRSCGKRRNTCRSRSWNRCCFFISRRIEGDSKADQTQKDWNIRIERTKADEVIDGPRDKVREKESIDSLNGWVTEAVVAVEHAQA